MTAAFLGAAPPDLAVPAVFVLAAPAFRVGTGDGGGAFTLVLADVALAAVVLLSADFLALGVLGFPAATGVLLVVFGLAAVALPALAVPALVPEEALVVLEVALFIGIFSPVAFRVPDFLGGVAGLKSSNMEVTSFFAFLTILVTASGIIGLVLFLVLGIVLLFSGK